MNLFKLHTRPNSLDNYDQVYERNPDFFWEKYEDDHFELKKR